MTENRFCNLGIYAILIIGCIWGGITSGWGLPSNLHPDEYFFVDVTLAMYADGVAAPRWYGAPASVLIYLAGAVVWLQWLMDVMFGQGRALDAYVAAVYDDPTQLIRSLRFVNHIIFLGAGLLLARLGEKLDRPMTGLVAMIGLLAVPLLLKNAVIWRMEPLSLLAVVMCLIACVKMFERLGTLEYRLAGGAVGFGVAVKFPLVVLAVPVMLSHYLAPKGTGEHRGGRRFAWLVAAGVYSLVAAFLLAPFMFIHFPLTYANVMIEARETHIGATGSGFMGNLIGYLGIMRTSIGSSGLALAALGLIVGLLRRERRLLVCWGFALVFLLFISALNL